MSVLETASEREGGGLVAGPPGKRSKSSPESSPSGSVTRPWQQHQQPQEEEGGEQGGQQQHQQHGEEEGREGGQEHWLKLESEARAGLEPRPQALGGAGGVRAGPKGDAAAVVAADDDGNEEEERDGDFDSAFGETGAGMVRWSNAHDRQVGTRSGCCMLRSSWGCHRRLLAL